MKYPCNMIRDILPLYHDAVCSWESKVAVEEHFEECQRCKDYYKKMCDSDVVEATSFDPEMEKKKADSYRAIKKKWNLKVIGIVGGISLLGIVLSIVVWAGLGFIYEQATVEVNTDIEQYEKYMTGDDAKEEYRNKWYMDESIFPDKITDNMNVTDYQMTYYNPWDAQYLGYLVVDYNEADYEKEAARLKAYESTEYLGNYGVTGFPEEYTLLAMYADDTYGFVYALTDNEDTIIYVEIIFCNYFLDVKCEKYIPEEYLPTDFDATRNNDYRKKMMDE